MEIFLKGSRLCTSCVPEIVRKLLFLCMVLAFSVLLTSGIQASEQQNIESYENLDARWLPWIGSWRLVSNTINTVGTPLNEEYLLKIRPGDEGKFVTMESSRDRVVMFKEKIAADGLRHPLNEDECSGWYSYSWSESGKRLLFNGESSCIDDLTQTISGMLLVDTIGEFVDIKLLRNGEEKAITIRRYRNADIDVGTPIPRVLSKAYIARGSTDTSFTIDEVIELSGKVEPEVLEAALVEMHSSFPINSKQLIRLSDAGVPSQIMDLMVALSFPKKFTVERAALSWVMTADSFRAPYYHWPMSPWYWTTSVQMLYGYRYWGWNWYQGYGWYPYSYQYYPYSHQYYIPGGGGSAAHSGNLVKERGYTRVYPGNSGTRKRYAQPRNAQAAGGGGNQQSSSRSFTSSGGVSTGSGYSAPSASPGGYSGGGGIGTAIPR